MESGSLFFMVPRLQPLRPTLLLPFVYNAYEHVCLEENEPVAKTVEIVPLGIINNVNLIKKVFRRYLFV